VRSIEGQRRKRAKTIGEEKREVREGESDQLRGPKRTRRNKVRPQNQRDGEKRARNRRPQQKAQPVKIERSTEEG